MKGRFGKLVQKSYVDTVKFIKGLGNNNYIQNCKNIFYNLMYPKNESDPIPEIFCETEGLKSLSHNIEPSAPLLPADFFLTPLPSYEEALALAPLKVEMPVRQARVLPSAPPLETSLFYEKNSDYEVPPSYEETMLLNPLTFSKLAVPPTFSSSPISRVVPSAPPAEDSSMPYNEIAVDNIPQNIPFYPYLIPSIYEATACLLILNTIVKLANQFFPISQNYQEEGSFYNSSNNYYLDDIGITGFNLTATEC